MNLIFSAAVVRIWEKILAWLKHPLLVWQTQQSNLVVTVELRQPLAILVMVGLLIWYLAYPSGASLMILVGLGVINAVSAVWAAAMAQQVRGSRQLRSSVMQVGDELEEQIYLSNQSWIPVLWAEFIDQSELPGYAVTSVRAVDMNHSIHWRVHVICTRRGVYQLGPWELHLGDLLGFYHITQRYIQPMEILVYPPLTVLPSDILPRSGVLGDHRQLRQSLPIDTINAISARIYQPGDPLRKFHWKITARQGHPFVRVFEPEAASRIWIIPDFDEAVHVGEGNQSTLEEMVLISASLSAQLLQANLAVGLFACADGDHVVTPGRGSIYLWKILRALAPLRAISDCPFSRVIHHASQIIPSRDLLVLLTPSLNFDWAAELQRFQMKQGRSGINVIFLDPFSYGGAQKSENVAPSLAELGLACRVIKKGEIKPLQETYGKLTRWEFKTLGTGRVVVKQSPRYGIQPESGVEKIWTR